MGNELYKELIKKRVRKRQTEFWDSKSGRPYSELNKIEDDAAKANNAIELHKIQVNQFETYISQTNPRFRAAQNFLNSLPKYKVQITDKIEEKSINEIFNVITKIINSPYKGGDKATKEMTDKAKRLESLLKSIKVNVPLTETMKKVLEGNTDININKYTQEKSDFFEEIITDYINGLKKGYIAMTTGKYHSLKDSNRQLIADIFVFLDNLQDKVKGTAIPFTPTGNYKLDYTNVKKGTNIEIHSDIQDFINQLEKMTGTSNIRIALDNELEESMDRLSAIKIQAKSGINQSILNKSMSRNSEALESFKDRKLNLLLELYDLDKTNNFIYFYKNQKKSKILTAYSNYLLSINIAKTSVMKNDIYATEKGFETALDYLNRKDSMHLRFVRGTKLTSSILSQNRRYQFYQTDSKK